MMEALMQIFMMFFVVAFAIVAVGANYLKHRLDAQIEGSASYSSLRDRGPAEFGAPRYSPTTDEDLARAA